MNKLNEKYYVLKRAYADYDETIVKVEDDIIYDLDFTGFVNEELSENEVEALKGKSISESIKFLIALNSINYQYWDIKEGDFYRYQNNGQVGALAAYEGFIKLWDDLKNNPEIYNNLNEETIKKYFGDIPESATRVSILKESLNEENLTKVANYIEESLKKGLIDTETALEVSKILPKSFSEPYLKKIQLALYEITLHARSHGNEVKESLTVAADYQLPKVMEAMGILTYNEKLKNKIDNHVMLRENSQEEKAIRAATIIACELISSNHDLSIPAIDRWLWLARNNYKNKNFHLTKTTAY